VKKIHISVVIPVYNEAAILEKNIKKAMKSIEKITDEYEIIIAEDGSDDGSDLIASQLAESDKRIIHLHFYARRQIRIPTVWSAPPV
jgi:glycosyltransferase involved in cell wall biosynthesis